MMIPAKIINPPSSVNIIEVSVNRSRIDRIKPEVMSNADSWR
jgi:hypothetical protein